VHDGLGPSLGQRLWQRLISPFMPD